MNAEFLVALELDDGERVAIEQFELDGLSQRWYRDLGINVRGNLKDANLDYLNSKHFEQKFDLITVVYLRSGDIDSSPLKKLNSIKDDLIELVECSAGLKPELEVDLRIIGPANSGQVFKILGEYEEIKVSRDNAPVDVEQTVNFEQSNDAEVETDGEKSLYLFSRCHGRLRNLEWTGGEKCRFGKRG